MTVGRSRHIRRAIHSVTPAQEIAAPGDYATALATVQAGDADGISYVLTENDPLAAIDLDHCRDPGTRSFDKWAMNWLDVFKNSYLEVTPSGAGARIWGLTADGTDSINRKFSLEINGSRLPRNYSAVPRRS